MENSTVSSSTQSIGGNASVHTLTHDVSQSPGQKTIETDTEDPYSASRDDDAIQNDEEAATSAEEASQPGPQSSSKSNTLQDQSNLLPMKQLIVVFAGLSCALFCELYKSH